MIPDSKVLVQVLYQAQNIVHLIGDVICPKNKFRDKKCLNSTSFEENNKSTYQGNESSAPKTTTPESERQNEPPRLLRSRRFGTRLAKVPDSVYRSLFR